MNVEHDALPRIADLVDKATRLRTEDKNLTYAVLVGEDLPTEDVATLWLSSQEWATAARAIEKALGEEVGRRVETRSITVGGYLIWYGARKQEKCVDSEGFFNWLRENPDAVEKAFNPNYARTGSIPPAVRDTFFEKSEVGEPQTRAVPVEMLGR